MSRSVPHNAPVVRRTSLMTKTPTVAAVVVCSVRSSSLPPRRQQQTSFHVNMKSPCTGEGMQRAQHAAW